MTWEYVAVLSTIFVFVFAIACFTTFACAARKEWKDARLISAIVAVLSFLMALLFVSVK